MTSSAKTLRALERAAMLWWGSHRPELFTLDEHMLYPCVNVPVEHHALARACAAHVESKAAALKRKRTGRR